MIAQDLKSALQGVCPEVAERASKDCAAFNVPIGRLADVMRFLRDEQGFDMLVDATGIDNGLEAAPRFTVVYHLLSTRQRRYARIAANCLSSEEPSAPSLVPLWPGANWHEREAFDLLGIRYEGHPDLRRILMWDGYPHHPLRKDFPLAGREEPLWDKEISEETGTTLIPAPMAGGPFVSRPSRFEDKREPRAKDESWNEAKEKPDN